MGRRRGQAHICSRALVTALILVGSAFVLSGAAAAATPGGARVPAAVPVAPRATLLDGGASSALGPGEIGYMYGISCPSRATCYAVGTRAGGQTAPAGAGLVLEVGRGAGGAWSVTGGVVLPEAGYLTSVSCTTVLRCAAVGATTGGRGIVLATDAGAPGWRKPVQPLQPSPVEMRAVSCVATYCMAVGWQYDGSGRSGHYVDAVWQTGAPTRGHAPSGHSPAATSWATVPSPAAGTADAGTWCTGPRACWVVGGGAWHTTDGGATWQQKSPVAAPGCPHTLCTVTYSLLDAVEFFGKESGIVAGGDQCGAAQIFSCPGAIFRTADGGASWHLASTSTAFVNSLACAGSRGTSCVGAVNQWAGFRGRSSQSTAVVASAAVSSSTGAAWAQGAWDKGVSFSGVACPPAGSSCLVAGGSATGGRGGIYLTGAPAPSNPEVSSIAQLPSPGHAFSNLTSDLVDAAIALALALFLTFPANLFNTTFEENYLDIVAWATRWRDRLAPAPVRAEMARAYRGARHRAGALWAGARYRTRRTGWAGIPEGLAPEMPGPEGPGPEGPGPERSDGGEGAGAGARFGAVLVVGSLLGALLDPAFGANTRSLLAFMAIACSMVGGVAIAGAITAGYHRAAGHGRVAYSLEALPLGLIVAALCVVVSRASGFTPGYLYGVIAGASFSWPMAPHQEGHLVAISSLAKVGLGIVAWVAWDGITGAAQHPGSFFGTVLVDDFLASLFVSSLVGTLIGLFPLRFLPGHKLASWHRGAWLGTFAATLFVLVQVLLRPHSTSAGPSHTPLVTTAALFVAFGAGSLAFREHFARKKARAEAADRGTGSVEDAVPVEALPAEGALADGGLAHGALAERAPAEPSPPGGPPA